MGTTYSFLPTEKETWKEKNLRFDTDVAEAQLKLLNNLKDGAELSLHNCSKEWGNLRFEHWFIANGTTFIEFGSPHSDIYSARVTISIDSNRHYIPNQPADRIQLNYDIRQRIIHVLGMSNYSLCLRNSEHVANYIFKGTWFSRQLDTENGRLMSFFKYHLPAKTLKIINSFPSCIRPHLFDKSKITKMYSFEYNSFQAKQFKYYLDSSANTYNIALLGPSGGGKSHLINVLFNDKICDSEVSFCSVTKEIYFIEGKAPIHDEKNNFIEMRDIVVADTVGLCDTEWTDKYVINLIKSRLSSNVKALDMVLIVCRADRLSDGEITNIKQILDWLDYNKNFTRIRFVSTFSEGLTQEQKDNLRNEAERIFGLKNCNESSNQGNTQAFKPFICTGFPPESGLNDTTKNRVQENLQEIFLLFSQPNSNKKIPLEYKPNRCPIL